MWNLLPLTTTPMEEPQALQTVQPISLSPNEVYGLAVKKSAEIWYSELTTSDTKLTDIPVLFNETYALSSITN